MPEKPGFLLCGANSELKWDAGNDIIRNQAFEIIIGEKPNMKQINEAAELLKNKETTLARLK